MEIVPVTEVVDEDEEVEFPEEAEEEHPSLGEKTEALEIAIYKGLMAFIILISIWMMFDSAFPLKSKSDYLVSRTLSRDGFILGTESNHHIEVTSTFSEKVNDSLPVTLFSTPFLNIPFRIEGWQKANPFLKISSKNINIDFTPFYAFLAMSLLLSSIGMFINDAQGKMAFMGASLFFMVIMLLMILPLMK